MTSIPEENTTISILITQVLYLLISIDPIVIIHSFATEREKVRQRGSGAESRSRTVYTKLESTIEPERARICQRVAVRASKSQREAQRESVRVPGNQSELDTTRKIHSEPE